VLGLCPRARDLVDGLLASDIAGFQTPGDCTNFLIAAEQILGAAVEHSSGTVRYRGR
jgi:trehalose-6-phosphate synthase